jgi:predicted dehydrogenase
MNIGLIGLGAIGRLHFDCWRKSTVGRLVAVSDRNPKRLVGDWAGAEFNIGEQAQAQVDLSDLKAYERAEDLLADPKVEIVDICLATPLHASVAVAALHAGKHVFCEKPMSLKIEDCAAMEEAARMTGKHLMIGHCLRFWPQYVKAQELLASGEFGRPLYADLHRSSPAPRWSNSGWYMNAAQSGGVLDMHIHDIDAALWWFGRPNQITTTGLAPQGLPMIIDTSWRYEDGPAVHMHASWDHNGGTFRHAFRLVMEKATLVHDLAVDSQALWFLRDGTRTAILVSSESGHQAELDYFAAQIAAGKVPARVTPAESRLAVELGLEELRQLGI